jgi:hypothetical protein
MEYLRRYAFWVAMGSIAIAIVALYFILVLPAVARNRGKAADIQLRMDMLENYRRKGTNIMTPPWADREEKAKAEWDEQYQRLYNWYKEAGEPLENYTLEGLETDEQGRLKPFVFLEIYRVKSEELLEKYQDALGTKLQQKAIQLPAASDTPWTQTEMESILKLMYLYEAFLDILKQERGLTSLDTLQFGLSKLLPRGASIGPTGEPTGMPGMEGMMPGPMPGMEGAMPGMEGAMPGMEGAMPGMEGAMPGMGMEGMSMSPTAPRSPGMRTTLGVEEYGGGLFQGIGFSLTVRMDFERLPEFLTGILEQQDMNPDFPLFTDIRAVSIRRLASYDYKHLVRPEVEVQIMGSVLDFIEEEQAQAGPQPGSTGFSSSPRR